MYVMFFFKNQYIVNYINPFKLYAIFSFFRLAFSVNVTYLPIFGCILRFVYAFAIFCKQ